MKLSDIMSAAGLAGYAEIGLILFMAVFIAVTVRVFWFGRRENFEDVSRIPLEGECGGACEGMKQGAEGEAS